MKNAKRLILLAAVVFGAHAFVSAQSFTYQGKLMDGGTAANGAYDLTFRLFDASVGGTQVGPPILKDDVHVTVGVFTVDLDFGSSPFTSSTGNFLEISVRPGASTGTFAPLTPLQRITSSPYAVQTIRAFTATVADNSLKLGGVDADQFVQDSDGRLTDARMPLAGSADYIQSNPATQQPGTNFNIGGNATVGGSLSGNVVNAATQYNIGDNRVLSVEGTQNIFAGVGAGQFNTGYLNSFFGSSAGATNTTGAGNSFFGANAGVSNSTGFNNSFVGAVSGLSNTDGTDNSFFGSGSGFSNTTGSSNSFVGTNAGSSNTTGFNNSFFGRFSGSGNTSGVYNSFFGIDSGLSNTTGDRNAFVGSVAGRSNTTGARNSFVGTDAGFSNTTGSDNTVAGMEAGFSNTTGSQNVFVGRQAGYANTVGGNNTVLGAFANVAANNLTFATAIGSGAVVSANSTVVLGRAADTIQVPGSLNVTGNFTGSFTVPAANIVGVLAAAHGGTGIASIPSAGNYLRSNGSGWEAAGLQTLDIPNLAASYIQNIPGIGTQTGSFNIDGGGNANIFNATTQYNIGGNRVLSVTGSDNLFVGSDAGTLNSGASLNTFVGAISGAANSTGFGNSFLGSRAGMNNIDGRRNSFFGAQTGQANTSGRENSFFGSAAGLNNISGNGNSIFGFNAGSVNTGSSNAFFGRQAGNANTVGNFNTLIGTSTDVGANNLQYATAIGAESVVSTNNTIVLGRSAAQDTVRIPGTMSVNGNVGIGTSTPNTKLQVAGGSVYIQNPNSLVITSPNGACWFITVNNGGALSTIAVACP